MLAGKQPKVLMITLRADYGGGPEHVYRLMKYIKKDASVFVACPKEEPYWSKYAELLGEDRMVELPHRKWSWSKFLKMLIFCNKHGVEIIHSHGKGAGLYSRLSGLLLWKSVVHSFHGIHYGQYGKKVSYLYLRFEEMLGWITDRFITGSPSEFDLAQELGITRARNLRLIKYGLEIPSDYSIKPDNFKPKFIISVTRFSYAKNPELSLQIIKILNQLLPDDFEKPELLFIGTSEGEQNIKNLSKELKLDDQVRFGGTQPNLSAWYSRAYIYLSTARWEGLSLAMQEAMAAGLPIVATRVTGNVDAVTHNFNGYLFDSNEPEIGAQYIAKLLTNYADYMQKSKASRQRAVDEYDVVEMAKKTMAVYEECMN